MEKVIFEKLKYGDKLVTFGNDGTIKYYTYLCREPNREKYHCLLLQEDYMSVIFSSPFDVEKMFIHQNYGETTDYSNKVRAKYYKDWLEEYSWQHK